MNDAAGSITRLIPNLRNRNEVAIEELWQRYVERVEGLARNMLTGLAPGAGDEQDVAQSTFHAFCEAVAEGQAPKLESRNELWRLLSTIARRKAADRIRRERRVRRGGGVRHDPHALDRVLDDEPSPSEVAQLQDVLDGLFQKLATIEDPKLQAVAVMRLEGAAIQEIAAQLGCTPRTIQRKLHILERLWCEQT